MSNQANSQDTNAHKARSRKARLSPAALLALAGLSGEAIAKEQEIYPAGSQPAFSGPEALFDGQVDVQVVFPEREGVPYSGAYVTFQAGARTAWHDHPAGQHMIVTQGTALTGTRDGQVIQFHEGEAVWCPDGVDHWHGATPDAAMTHFVVTASQDGQNVNWKDKVSDEVYQAAVASLQDEHTHFTALDERQQHLTYAIALATLGQSHALMDTLDAALANGVPVSDLREAMIHLYPYAGFPRSLNALNTLMQVVEARNAAGYDTAEGQPATLLSDKDDAQALGQSVQTALVGAPVGGPLFDFAPGANVFLQKHLFGDVFARGVLSHQDRELLTLAILAVMPNTDGQLNAHINMARNAGVSDDQMAELGQLLTQRITAQAGARLVQRLNQ
ncbi:MAG: carboxymuconolactone decarboxylase family protein [Pseudomonadota bacterium]|nr:carboxymuconolactone decarboxylase family protein [Pseudomonadota bacterium]